MSGWILHRVSGAHGLSGWQWLFLLETIPSLVLGIVTLFYLDDRVAAAKWLDEDEKRIVVGNVASEEAEKEDLSQLSAAFRTPRVWLLGLIYFGIVSGIYLNSFWVPTIIKQTGVSDPLQIGLLTAIPYVVAVIAMIAVNSSADRRRERRWHTLVPCLATAGRLRADRVGRRQHRGRHGRAGAGRGRGIERAGGVLEPARRLPRGCGRRGRDRAWSTRSATLRGSPPTT